MRYLLDTHALLWWLSGSTSLSETARRVCTEPSNIIYVSAASAWEITTKHRLGKLAEARNLAPDVAGRLNHEGFLQLAITMPHAELAGRLDGSHRDPFDRMIMAQSLIEGLSVVSNEVRFDAFGVSRLW